MTNLTKDDVFVDVLDATTARRRVGRGARMAWGIGSERREGVRTARATALGPEAWELQLLPVRHLEDLAEDIASLEKRAAEPNLFFSLPVLRAAYPRLARGRGREGAIRLLCLWRVGESGERRLVLFAPLASPRLGWPGRRTAMVAASPYTPVGTPLVERDGLADTVERCLAMASDPVLGLPATLALPESRLDGPVAHAFRKAAERLGLATATMEERQRAVLRPGETHALSRRRTRDHERQMRRLKEQGEVAFHIAREPVAILDAFEAFMALELASWKGRRGTALYNSRPIAAFSRQAVSALAERGACAIHSLVLDGRTIASLIVLGDVRRGEVYTWKTAYDAAFEAQSPGVLLMLDATERLAKRDVTVDSLAAPDHPVMNRLWASRAAMGTLLVGTRSDAVGDLRILSAAMDRRERWRERLRRLLGR